MDPARSKSTSYFNASASFQKSLETSSYVGRIGHVAHAALKNLGNVFSPLLFCGTRSLAGRIADSLVNLAKTVLTVTLVVPSAFLGLKGVSIFISGKHDLHLQKYETALLCYGKKDNGAVYTFRANPHLKEESAIGKALHECLQCLTPRPDIDARQRYQQFVKKFDEVALVIMDLEDRNLPLTDDKKACIDAAKELALDRWSGVDMNAHYEKRVELATGSPLPESTTFEELPTQMRVINDLVKKTAPKHKKSRLALMWQKFCGGPLGIKYYTGTENVPNKLGVLHHKDLPDIVQMRHGSPTTGVKCDGLDTIAPNYELFIRAVKAEGKTVFYTIHQKLQKTSPEDESPRTKAILQLQDKYPDTFYAMVQPLDGSFYKKEGVYKTQMNFSQLIRGLEFEFFDNTKNPSARLPKKFQNEKYRQRFREIATEVHTRFFRGRKMLSKESWQDFIHIFYAYQRIDLRTRIGEVPGGGPLGYVVTACKDDLDRGGGQQLLEHILLLLFELKQSTSPSATTPMSDTPSTPTTPTSGSSSPRSDSPLPDTIRQKLTDIRLHMSGAPINTKMVAVVQSRLDPILGTIERVINPNISQICDLPGTFFDAHEPISVTYR